MKTSKNNIAQQFAIALINERWNTVVNTVSTITSTIDIALTFKITENCQNIKNVQCECIKHTPHCRNLRKTKRCEMTIEELENKIAEFAAEIATDIEKLKNPVVATWEPEGGNFYIRPTGETYHDSSSCFTRSFGVERKTKEAAEKARDAMRVFNRLLAYRDEVEPDYANVDFCYHLVIIDGEWDVACVGKANHPLAIYFNSEKNAQILADKLNRGEVLL